MGELSQHAFDRAEEIGDALHFQSHTLDMLEREIGALDLGPHDGRVHTLLAALRAFSADAASKAAQIARSGVT